MTKHPGLLTHLAEVLDRRGRLRLAALAGVILVGSVVEVVGVGLVVPYVTAVSDPAAVLAEPRFGPLLAGLGMDDTRSLILGLSLAMALAFVFKNAYLALQWRAFYTFLFREVVAVSKRLLRGYLLSPYTFHLAHNSAALIRNTTVEVSHLFMGVVHPLLVLGIESLVATGLIALLFVSAPSAAAAAVVVLGLGGGGFSWMVRQRLGKLGRDRAEASERMIRWVNQGLGGIKETKVLGREEYFVDAFETEGARYAAALRANSLYGQYPRMVIETCIVVLVVGLVSYRLISRGEVASFVPQLALLGAAAVRLLPSATRVVNALNRLRFHRPAADIVGPHLARLASHERAASRPEPASRIGPLEESIELQGVSYSYPDSEAASLEEIDLAVRHGESLALVGSSGAGKTTLANLLLGLLTPSAGRIEVDGVELASDPAGWQRQIGYIPQDIYLSDTSLAENVAFGLPAAQIDEAAVWAALEAAHLAEFARSLPAGLATVTGERGVRISGGQRQRLGVARALYHQPSVLVLDEATSNLDAETERALVSTVQGLAGEKTLIVIAHRLSTVRFCDRIAVLDRGRLSALGTWAELARTSAVFRRLVAAASDGAHDVDTAAVPPEAGP